MVLWGHCHYMGQDFLAVSVGTPLHLVKPGARRKPYHQTSSNWDGSGSGSEKAAVLVVDANSLVVVQHLETHTEAGHAIAVEFHPSSAALSLLLSTGRIAVYMPRALPMGNQISYRWHDLYMSRQMMERIGDPASSLTLSWSAGRTLLASMGGVLAVWAVRVACAVDATDLEHEDGGMEDVSAVPQMVWGSSANFEKDLICSCISPLGNAFATVHKGEGYVRVWRRALPHDPMPLGVSGKKGSMGSSSASNTMALGGPGSPGPHGGSQGVGRGVRFSLVTALEHSGEVQMARWHEAAEGAADFLISVGKDRTVKLWREVPLGMSTTLKSSVVYACVAKFQNWKGAGISLGCMSWAYFGDGPDMRRTDYDVDEGVAGQRSWMVGLDQAGNLRLWALEESLSTDQECSQPVLIEAAASSVKNFLFKAEGDGKLYQRILALSVTGFFRTSFSDANEGPSEIQVAFEAEDESGCSGLTVLNLVLESTSTGVDFSYRVASIRACQLPFWLKDQAKSSSSPSSPRHGRRGAKLSRSPVQPQLHPTLPLQVVAGTPSGTHLTVLSWANADTFSTVDAKRNPGALENTFVPKALPALQLPGISKVVMVAWVQDWVGAEEYPPALMVTDSKGRGHFYKVSAHFNPTPKSIPYLDETPIDMSRSTWRNSVSGSPVLSARASTNRLQSLSQDSSILGAGTLMEADLDTEEVEIQLQSDSEAGLGLLVDFRDNKAFVRGFKSHPKTGSKLAAELHPQVHVGDEIITINKYRIEGLDRAGATQVVKEKGSQLGGTVTLQLRASLLRRRGSSDLSTLSASRTSHLRSVTSSIDFSHNNAAASVSNFDRLRCPSSDRGATGGATQGASSQQGINSSGFWKHLDSVDFGFPLSKQLVLPYQYPDAAGRELGSARGSGMLDQMESPPPEAPLFKPRKVIVVGVGRPKDSNQDVMCAWSITIQRRSAAMLSAKSSSSPGAPPSTSSAVGQYVVHSTELARIVLGSSGKQLLHLATIQGGGIGGWFIGSCRDGWVRRYSLRQINGQADVAWELHTQDLFLTESDSPVTQLSVASADLIATVHQREELHVYLYSASLQFPRTFQLESRLDLSTSLDGEEGWVPYSKYVPLKCRALVWLPWGDDPSEVTLCVTDGSRARLFNRRRKLLDPENPDVAFQWTPILELDNPAWLLPSPTAGLVSWLHRYLVRTGTVQSKVPLPLSRSPSEPSMMMTAAGSSFRKAKQADRFQVEGAVICDWHPRALVNLLCTSGWEPRVGRNRVMHILDWLTRSESFISDDGAVENDPHVHQDKDNEIKKVKNEVVPLPSFLHRENSVEISDTSAIDALAELLRGHMEEYLESFVSEEEKEAKKNEKKGATASLLFQTTERQPSTDLSEKNELQDLPSTLSIFEKDQQLQLWALMDMALNEDVLMVGRNQDPKLDWLAQFFVVSRGFLSRLLPEGQDPNMGEHVSSSATLAALLSTNQDELIDMVCPPGSSLSWAWARALRISFWVRSLKTLRRVTENIASSMYRQTKDPLQVALFYVALGKKSTLLQLAKLDKNTNVGKYSSKLNFGKKEVASDLSSGAKLVKILSIDLSTASGRATTEKNAYVLLRKRQYVPAAALFLLTQPPMLGEALHVIFTHLKDTTLGFLVMRLMGPTCVEPETMGRYALDAISRSALKEHVMPQLEKRKDVILQAAAWHWLQDHRQARETLAGFDALQGDFLRGLRDTSKKDSEINLYELKSMGSRQKTAASFDIIGNNRPAAETAVRFNSALREANDWMDQSLFAFLVHELNGRGHTLWRATMNSARILADSGLEVPSLLVLQQMKGAMEGDRIGSGTRRRRSQYFTASEIVKPEDAADTETPLVGGLGMAPLSPSPGNAGPTAPGFGGMMRSVGPTHGTMGGFSQVHDPGAASGSIFDDFASPPPQTVKKPAQEQDPGAMDSGIFGAFDVPVQKPRGSQKSTSKYDTQEVTPTQAEHLNQEPEFNSGVFADFDLPSPRRRDVQKPVSKISPAAMSTISSSDLQIPEGKQIDFDSQVRSGAGALSSASSLQRKHSEEEVFTGSSSGGIFGDFEPAPPMNRRTSSRDSQLDPFPDQSADWQKNTLDPGAPMRGRSMSFGKQHRGKIIISSKQAVEQMQSSIFDDFSPVPQVKALPRKKTMKGLTLDFSALPEEDIAESSSDDELADSTLWEETWWHQQQAYTMAARRILREANAFLQGLDTTPPSRPQMLAALRGQMVSGGPAVGSGLGPFSSGSERHLVGRIAWLKATVTRLSKSFGLDWGLLLSYSLQLLQWQDQRLVVACLLLQLLKRYTVIDTLVCISTRRLIQRCCSQYNDVYHPQLPSNAFAQPDPEANLNSIVNAKELRQIYWQLEFCMWLHSTGCLSLSLRAQAEAVVGVRIGMLLECWGLDYEVLYDMIKHPPDTSGSTGRSLVGAGAEEEIVGALRPTSPSTSDEESIPVVKESSAHKFKRVLSSKLPHPSFVSSSHSPVDKKGSSGSSVVIDRSMPGWEYFRENVNRNQAEQMLAQTIPGTFIIRVHEVEKDAYTLSFSTGDMPPHRAVAHATLRVASTDPVRLRCGDLGPCAGLQDLLYLIASALPTGLVFDDLRAQELDVPISGPSSPRVVSPPQSPRRRTSSITNLGHQDSAVHFYSPNVALLRSLALHRKGSTQSEVPEQEQSEDTLNEVNASEVEDPLEPEVWPVSAKTATVLDMLILRCLHHHLEDLMSDRIIQQEIVPTPARLDGMFIGVEPKTKGLGSLASASAEGGVYKQVVPTLHHLPSMLHELHQWSRLLNRQFYSHLHKRKIGMLEALALQAVKPRSRTHSFSLYSYKDKADDLLVRNMVSVNSGINFHTVRKGGTGSRCPVVVCFFASEAAEWLHRIGFEDSHQLAYDKLKQLEMKRIIERVEIQDSLPNQWQNVFYRFVDEWEVEPVLEASGGILRKGPLGRTWYSPVSSQDTEGPFTRLLKEAIPTNVSHIWSMLRGESWLIQIVSSTHYPSITQGDLVAPGSLQDLDAYSTCIAKHLYRSLIFTRLKMPHRYMALVQVELLDLKKLAPTPSPHKMDVYAVLRLQRRGSSVVLSNKTRTLDSIMIQPKKIVTDSNSRSTPWGGKAAFRFALPEAYLRLEGQADYRHVVNRGAPKVLHICVYSKHFLMDSCLGDVEIPLTAITDNNHLDEWLPLRCEKGTSWFMHVRLKLRFVLMCVSEPDLVVPEESPKDSGKGIFSLRRIMDEM